MRPSVTLTVLLVLLAVGVAVFFRPGRAGGTDDGATPHSVGAAVAPVRATAPAGPAKTVPPRVRTPQDGAAAALAAATRPDFAAWLPADARESLHPVERAAAAGETLDARWEPLPESGLWRRERLMKTPVQPRLVRVVEEWRAPAFAGATPTAVKREMFLADQIIVQRAAPIGDARFQAHLAALGFPSGTEIAPGVFTVTLPAADLDAVPAALATLAREPGVFAGAEADGVGFGGALPDDTHFATHQWNLHNTGQSGGSIGADVGAPAFWRIAGSTPGVVIAVLDSGLNFTHPDLLDLDCLHPGEIAGDGFDNDGNGFIDDHRGWDWVNNDNDPTDDHGHGSNVTGIIAATRGNAAGLAGLIHGPRFVIGKILNASNSGFTSHLIAATAYARQRGARVMNLSLQNYPYSDALDAEFSACDAAGITLVICAGNQGLNNDVTPNYPSSYPHANVISVGNHDRHDQRWSGAFNPSNYGAVRVDLFAPGREIIGPILGSSYSLYTGTSQAAPHVTAVAAAILHANPTWTATEVKAAVLGSAVTSPAYAGLCVSGGRLHALAALSAAVRQQAANDTDGDGWSNLLEYLAGTRLDLAEDAPAPLLEHAGAQLRLTLPRVTRGDAMLVLETSTDLVTWTTAGIADESTAETLAGAVTFDAGTPRVFLRLRAAGIP